MPAVCRLRGEAVKADRIAGIVVCLFGAAVAVAASHIDVLPANTLSARFFPYLVAACLLLGGVMLALRPGSAPLSEVMIQLLDRRALSFGALFLVYTLTFRYIDFRVGTWLFVLASLWILGSRRPLELVLVPVAVSGLVYLQFRHGFTVMLPTWN